MNNLTVLADDPNHENLLRAKVAAWLHDFWKCTDEHVEHEAFDRSPGLANTYRTVYLDRLGTHEIVLPGEPSTFLRTLIEEYMRIRNNEINDRSKPWLARLLKLCHNVAHTEKETDFYLIKQSKSNTRRGNPFGYESEPLTGLTGRLEESLKPLSSVNTFERSKLKEELETAFSYACADTRRPINEVTLWDWSVVVGAFYKAATAAALLGVKAEPPSVAHWQLLSIRVNGFAFIEQAVRISDVLARQKLIHDGLDKVRELLEVTYPLGTEIYRDMNGSTFIAPSLSDSDNLEVLLGLEDGAGKTLKMRIETAFSSGTINGKDYLQIGKEVVPSITDKTKRWARPDFTHQEPLPIANHLKEKGQARPDPEAVRDWWKNHREDVCTVCRVRPQGWGIDNEFHYRNHPGGEKSSLNCQTCKALARRVCTICELRREDRADNWVNRENLRTTIWIDEVSDKYGRIALVVGKFDLKRWLNGKVLFYPNFRRELSIESHNVSVIIRNIEKLWAGGYQIELEERLPGVANGDNCSIQGKQFRVIKRGFGIETVNAGAIKLVEEQIIHPGRGTDKKHFQPLDRVSTDTPARLYRVWETTRRFWKGIEGNFEKTVGKTDLRLRIQGTFDQDKSTDENLGNFHAYELKLGHVNLSVVHIGGDEFITADNLERVALLLNPTEKLSDDYEGTARRVFDRLVEESNKEKKGLQLEVPTGYGNPAKVLGRLRLPDGLKFEQALDQTAYVPAVSILADPETFMAIVPASKALNVVRGIRDDEGTDSKKEPSGIKEQYEEQMGKVRNRLPMTVGIVFAGRRTPLPAILDAGRRMLKQPASDEVWGEDWSVENIDPPLPRATRPSQVTLTLKKIKDSGKEAEGSDADGGGKDSLPMQEQQELSITVQTVMGDKTTPDEWFPFWHMKSPVPDSWVHVCDLHVGDIVHFTSSRFDFEFLETAAQRFEISYEEDKRRGSKHPRRPYYLEDLDDFDRLWGKGILAGPEGLTTSQIHNLIENIEGTRLEWQGSESQDTFERIVRDALDKAAWKKHPRHHPELFNDLHRAAVSGQLADVVELYMRILKEKPKRDQEEGKS